ncbi:MAG: AI-2E family transporter [Cardiobacteriaceae bacterium]|nr:AI-2E family transporter [Cardiobacteriaceae bacterium]
MHQKNLQPAYFFMYLVIALLVLMLIHGLSSVMMPFIWAFVLAYLGSPMVRKLESTKRFGRTRAVIVVFSMIFLLFWFALLIILPLIGGQFSALMAKLPNYLQWFDSHLLQPIAKLFNLENDYWKGENLALFLQQHIGSSSKIISSLGSHLIGSAGTIISFFSYAILIPVITFYLMCDWEKLLFKISEMIPRKYEITFRHLAQQSDYVLGEFFRGQLMVMLALAILYALGLSALGLDMAIALGFFAGLISFVPYLGLIIGITFAGILAILQFQDIWHPLGVVLVFTIAQTIEATVLTPKLVGDRTGLHPVTVMFALLAGGQWFGFTGILVALPVAAVLNVILSYYKQRYLASDFYLSQP